MSKYYTPSIEEFHKGFRFEHENFDVGDDNPEDIDGKYWIKSQINRIQGEMHEHRSSLGIQSLSWIESLDDVYVRNTFRVKYLDKSDIEELGWEFYHSGAAQVFKIKGYELEYEGSDTQRIDIFTNYDNNHPIFSGRVKNYNELKRLMTQIGII